MENEKEKIEKLEELIFLLEGQEKKRSKKLSLQEAKLKLKLSDLGFDVNNSLTYFNKGLNKEFLVSFLNENYLTPFLIKLINKL